MPELDSVSNLGACRVCITLGRIHPTLRTYVPTMNQVEPGRVRTYLFDPRIIVDQERAIYNEHCAACDL